jgi:uncharacterized delta-60 repeat protein
MRQIGRHAGAASPLRTADSARNRSGHLTPALILAVLVLSLPALASGAAGALDTAFGNGGLVVTTNGTGGILAVALQPDGKIIAAGTGGAARDFELGRYNPDGTLDASFGNGGLVTTNFDRRQHRGVRRRVFGPTQRRKRQLPVQLVNAEQLRGFVQDDVPRPGRRDHAPGAVQVHEVTTEA